MLVCFGLFGFVFKSAAIKIPKIIALTCTMYGREVYLSALGKNMVESV
jgi:hypothetical protein